MVEERDYDLVVAGGRTVGSNVATRFAGQGYDVLLVEKEETVGEPFCCSGHYSGDLWDLVPDRAERLTQHEIRGARFHADGDAYRYHKDDTVSWVVDRKRLDQLMYEEAQEAGVDTVTGQGVEQVEEHERGVTVTLDGGEAVEAGMVAGCDGARSTVREAAGIDDPGTMLTGVLGYSDEQDHDPFVDVHLDVPGFFAWRIPRGDHGVEYGAGAEDPGVAHDRLETLAAEYGVELEERYAAPIPLHPPEEVSSERVFLVGDAAGQTKPFTGGGIVYGLRAGNAAADTIHPHDPGTVQDYEDAWRDELGRDIRLGEWVRKAYDAPALLQKPAMRYFEGDISGIHMDRPTTLLPWKR